MTVIVNAFEEAGPTVSEKKMGPILLWTQNQASLTSMLVVEAARQRYATDRQMQVFVLSGHTDETADVVPGDQTTGPTRVGMSRSVQAGAVVRYGDPSVQSDRDADVQVCDVDSWLAAYRCAPQRGPQALPSDHFGIHLRPQDPHEGTT